MSEKKCHVSITGQVQGVGFRAWVERSAIALGLAGWVRNRPSGEVEAVFSGPEEKVDAMLRACREGPPAARVEDIVATSSQEQPGEGFVVRATG